MILSIFKKILLWCGISIIVLLLISHIHILMFNDITVEPISPEDNLDFNASEIKARPPVYLVSYTDGPEVFFKNQNALSLSSLNKSIDFIFNYRRSHLDPEFVKKNAHILHQKKGAGYWLWKPYCILKTLEKSPPGAIIVYADTGIIFRGSIAPLLKKLNQHDIILYNYQPYDHQTVENVVKRDALIKMGCDTEKCRQSPHIVASFMIFKNTPASRNFVTQWLKYCEDATVLTDTPSIAPEHSGYKGHKHDQGILTVLNYKIPHKILAIAYPELTEFLFWHHRKTGQEFRSLIPRMSKNIRGIETKIINADFMIKLRSYFLPKFFTNQFEAKKSKSA